MRDVASFSQVTPDVVAMMLRADLAVGPNDLLKVLRDIFDEDEEPTLDHKGQPVQGDRMKGGRKGRRDKRFGRKYSDKFWEDHHRRRKKMGEGDIESREELDGVYKEWEDLGCPLPSWLKPLLEGSSPQPRR